MNFRSVISGMLLGDSWLTFNRVNSYISFYHSPKQEQYLDWKINLLKEYGIVGTKKYTSKTETNYPKFKFWSKSDKRLTVARSWLYQFRNTPEKRRKFISKTTLRLLTPEGFAIWFMDDGYNSSSRNYMQLGTYCFSYDENVLITEWLKEKYDIETRIYKRKNQPFLVWYKDASKIRDILIPTIEQIPCMLYKIQ